MNSKLLLTTIAGGFAASALLVAAPASASTTINLGNATATFTDGPAHSPTGGYVVVDHFNTLNGLTCNTVGLCQIKIPPSDGNGAVIANSSPSGTPYLSVLGGGSGSLTFSGAISTLQFDWGSVDTYNTLTIGVSGGPDIHLTGSDITNPANGDQTAPGTNGLFTITGLGATTFTGITFASSSNSFEVDNLATTGGITTFDGAPEPTTWAMMIMGFGMAGAAMRARRRMAATA